MSYIVGITGGIATGKSNLTRALTECGARVADADRISRSLTANNGQALEGIRRQFGDSVFNGGMLDRKALGSIVFSDPAALAQLNTLMHPLIRAEVRRQIKKASDEGLPVLFIDAPLLYETGLDSFCDEVWCAWVPRQIQLERLMSRDHLSKADALARMNSQMSAWKKRLKADRFIDTRRTLEESGQIAVNMYRALLKKLTGE